MLIAVDKSEYIIANDDKFVTSISYHPTVIDSSELDEFIKIEYKTFEEAYANEIPIVTKRKLFGFKRIVVNDYSKTKILTPKNFKNLIYFKKFEMHPEWDLNYLFKELPHEDFISLLNDRKQTNNGQFIY